MPPQFVNCGSTWVKVIHSLLTLKGQHSACVGVSGVNGTSEYDDVDFLLRDGALFIHAADTGADDNDAGVGG